MKRLFLGASVFSVMLLAAVLHMAPASWFDLILMRASGGVIALGNSRGTIWEGRGRLQAFLPHGESLALEEVRWSVARLDLLRGQFHLRVFAAGSGKLLADMGLERSGLLLRNLQVDFPAVLLGAFSPTLRNAGLSGTLQVQANDLRLAGRAATGTASIVWNNATSSFGGIGRLGSYRIEFSGSGNGLACQVTTLDATALKLSGTCQLSPGQPLRVDGTAEPAENAQARLVPVLRVIGRETRPGTYRLQLDRSIGLG